MNGLSIIGYAVGGLICAFGLVVGSNAVTNSAPEQSDQMLQSSGLPAVREANPDLRFYGHAAIPLHNVPYDWRQHSARQADQVLGA